MKFQGLVLIFLLSFGLAKSFASAPACRLVHTGKGQTINAKTEATIRRYLQDTLMGLETLRGETGLLSDAIWIQNQNDGSHKIQTLNSATSPTNMAVDLLIQSEISNKPEAKKSAERTLLKVLNTLEGLEFHKDTGLFFSRYSADTKTPEIKDSCVSSIDNLHLAIALWTLHENHPNSAIGKKAGKLFERMDFSIYYDKASGLIGGNLRKNANKWEKESYNFANLGSEARLLYSAGWALGLFRNIKNDSVYLHKAFKQLKLETYESPEGKLLKLWDGSAFQLFFPRIFANENLYSSVLTEIFENTGKFMVAEGRRRHIPTPAAHSATRVGTHEENWIGEGSIYRDKGGNLKLVSSDNLDVNDKSLRKNWQGAFAPYALVMAATAKPDGLIARLQTLEKIQSGNDLLYQPGLGWMEGVHVGGKLKGEVVASQLSLNQGMLALSLLQIADPAGMSASSRALYNNPATRKRLEIFYKFFDKKVAEEK